MVLPFSRYYISFAVALLLYVIGYNGMVAEQFSVPCPPRNYPYAEDCFLFHRVIGGIYLGAIAWAAAFLSYRKHWNWKALLFIPFLLLLIFDAYRGAFIFIGGDIRFFGFRAYVTMVQYWASFMLCMQLWLVLYPDYRKVSRKLYLIATLLITIGLVVLGRGSVYQFNTLIGGLFLEVSYRALDYSFLWGQWIELTVLAVVYALIMVFVAFIKKGSPKVDVVDRVLKPTALVMGGSAITLISLLPGHWMAERDIEDAQHFVDKLIPSVEQFYEEEEEYPLSIVGGIVPLEEKLPFLLDRFEVLARPKAGGLKGGYYLSRPNKFCFMLQDMGITPGYYSITNESNGWKYFEYDGRPLESFFWEVCGDPTPVDIMVQEEFGIDLDDPTAGPMAPPPDEDWKPSPRFYDYLQRYNDKAQDGAR